jgi:hypothetical protein
MSTVAIVSCAHSDRSWRRQGGETRCSRHLPLRRSLHLRNGVWSGGLCRLRDRRRNPAVRRGSLTKNSLSQHREEAGWPDYVPKIWWRGTTNRWFAARPQRVFGWFVGASAVACGFVVRAVLDPGAAFGSPIAVAGLVGAVLVLGQAVVHGPRALRAMRRH